MNATTCNELDDYLDDQMTPSGRAAFEAHLVSCDACRRAIELHHSMYALLRRATVELEKPPHRLVVAIGTDLRRVNRRRFAWIVPSAMAAASILIAMRVWVVELLEHNSLQRPAPASRDTGWALKKETNQVADFSTRVSTTAQAHVQLSFDGAHDAIALPVVSDDPSVSIFWLYPIQTSVQGSNIPETESTEEPSRSKT